PGGCFSMGDPDEETFEGPPRRPYLRGGRTPSEVLEKQFLIRVSGVQGEVWACQGLPGPATFSGWGRMPLHPSRPQWPFGSGCPAWAGGPPSGGNPPNPIFSAPQ